MLIEKNKFRIAQHSVPIPVKIWSQVGIDLMCLTETDDSEEDKRGYKFIITAQCYFSKYIKIGALKTKNRSWKCLCGYMRTYFVDMG